MDSKTKAIFKCFRHAAITDAILLGIFIYFREVPASTLFIVITGIGTIGSIGAMVYLYVKRDELRNKHTQKEL
ncbi:hypothetical protein [Butyrivibrio proteoclasticus]|uniref:hypothetical protein n=1 Tax=Butyrivibrio proteoclasticus TaxID=43305 RepID=UPI00047A0423|nr:hypothetical protein [Butyrivibrio proteoclasticus]